MSGLPLVPVSCPSLCTQDKHLEVQLQATSKLVVSSLKFFFFHMDASRRGWSGKKNTGIIANPAFDVND